MIELGHGVSVPQKFWTHSYQELFPPNLLMLITSLYEEFHQGRKFLIDQRTKRQAAWDRGELPTFLDRHSFAVTGKWSVAPIPSELQCRRVEITGPVNSAKMVINMLNRNEDGSRADMAMLDFEDSMKPTFENVLDGYKNVIGAVSGNLSYYAQKSYQLNSKDMAYPMIRVRGLHLLESNVRVFGEPVPAGLLDLAVTSFHTLKLYQARKWTPKFYVPKCEHYLEARWWNQLFTRLEQYLSVPTSTLRATFLIETLPAAFQAEEILYELKDHAVGLNVGRWDKIFSDIKVLRNHADRILPDRATINLSRPWMENYAKRVIKICHDHGAFAMGGMSAFTPGKTPELRAEQAQKVRDDKKLEAEWGHDGCWVSHPHFIGTAMEAFKKQNQLDTKLTNFDKYSSLLPEATGPLTLVGLRTNIRVGIAYLHGWNQDLGCVAFDNLMEDLATLEISRAQTWQWLHHGVVLEHGHKVTPLLVKHLFDEELQKINTELNPGDQNHLLRDELIRAKDQAQLLFLEPELRDFLTTTSGPE